MAASGAKQITFDSLSGVQVGDEILLADTKSRRLTNKETIKVASIDSTYVCTLSKSITLLDNKRVVFRRSTSYKLNLETTGVKNSRINSIYPTYTISQNIGTIITFNATTTDGTTTINGGSAGVTHTASYGSGNKLNSNFVISYTLEGGRTLTQIANKPRPSDFVIASGDATMRINIESSGSGTTTYKLIAYISLAFGTTDTVVNLNLDNIVSYS